MSVDRIFSVWQRQTLKLFLKLHHKMFSMRKAADILWMTNPNQFLLVLSIFLRGHLQTFLTIKITNGYLALTLISLPKLLWSFSVFTTRNQFVKNVSGFANICPKGFMFYTFYNSFSERWLQSRHRLLHKGHSVRSGQPDSSGQSCHGIAQDRPDGRSRGWLYPRHQVLPTLLRGISA